ncbi:MAG: Transcriptional regulator SkgA, mercury resistance [Rickettsiaceae bacterium]|jgi:DNA-binding transcriptional MerR regulator|nr:Transcriptional regulator SkgA, mercury resistance [Rickettsiaceae bacterium]
MQWYVKDLSKLTSVSVRALHHYDEIGLLKPSGRHTNGYRLYSEVDLLRLQQILALKAFGFKLSEIKNILIKTDGILAHLEAQQKILNERVKILSHLSRKLAVMINYCKANKSIPWQNIIDLMEDYNMKKELFYLPDSERQKTYEKYLIDTNRITSQQLEESRKQSNQWKPEEWNKIHQEFDSLNKAFVEAILQNHSPNSDVVQDLVQTHYNVIIKFWTPNKEAYSGLGDLYLEHDDFRKFYTSYHPDLAEFLVKAMKVFAEKHL